MDEYKHIAILGYGIEGQSAYTYFKDSGAVIHIFEEKESTKVQVPEGVEVHYGPFAEQDFSGFDLIMRTPAVRPDKIVFQSNESDHPKVWTLVNEFFKVCPTGHVVGVTGTKGKGTTSTLIYEILKSAGKRAHLGGNIGVPVLDMLPDIHPDDIVLLELSSFQCWDLAYSPEVAVILMIEPEHQDVHVSVEEYVQAKAQLVRHQSPEDLVIFHPTNEASKQIAEKSPGHKVPYGRISSNENKTCYVESGRLYIGDQLLCDVNEVGLIGPHNLENICAAVTAAWHYTRDVSAIADAVRSFKGLPFRMQFIGEKQGVKFYNDSFSSAPGAAVAAMNAVTLPKVMILGGKDRNLDLTEIAEATKHAQIRKLILIGETASKLEEALSQAGVDESLRINLGSDSSMQEIVGRAMDEAAEGDAVILSPGCPSFDMFQNFTERGELFNQAVGELPDKVE